MPLRTTVVGSYPKPDDLDIPGWFRQGSTVYCAGDYEKFMQDKNVSDIDSKIAMAVKQAIEEQESFGLDVVTDGELPRDNYIFHFCRHVKNFDFKDLTYKVYRNGAMKNYLPTIRGKVEPNENDIGWTVKEWERGRDFAKSAEVQYTLPGPMTITNTTCDEHYKEMKALSEDLIKCINAEVLALSKAGCKHIQIDEPILVRLPDIALDYGIDHLARCFEGCGPDVVKTVHLCCGYPPHLDAENYLKADKDAYIKIADKLDNAGFDCFSIEDAHRRNDFELFKRIKKSSIILGSIKIASSKVESKEEIRSRVSEVLKYVPPERLWLAPDCGLGFLPHDILKQKMTNLVAVAKMF